MAGVFWGRIVGEETDGPITLLLSEARSSDGVMVGIYKEIEHH
jgi:hypothetical protein